MLWQPPDDSGRAPAARTATTAGRTRGTAGSPFAFVLVSPGGSGGIRTPEWFPTARFQGECIRPLCHASTAQPTQAARDAEPKSEEEKHAIQKAERIGKKHYKGDYPALQDPKNMRDDPNFPKN